MGLLLRIIYYAFEFYSMALVIFILMSWFPRAYETWVGRFLSKICEPYLEPFKRFIPPIGMIDISPIVALLVLQFARGGLLQLFNWVL
ncbi:YggT family protein [Peribacillus sp. B-H-3]|uniref:YggT family protein n=1 Tax=Peribacillus sp. B-H-3 TaxID=3400420 RepID=UPI003B0266B0